MTHLIEVPGKDSELQDRMKYFIYETLGSNPNRLEKEIKTDAATIRNIIGSPKRNKNVNYRRNKPSVKILTRFIEAFPNLNPTWWFNGVGDPLIDMGLEPTETPTQLIENREVDEQVIFNIRTIRKGAGLTQKDFAEQLGTTPAKINNIEMNRVNPTVSLIKNIVKRFNVSYHQVLEDVRDKSPEADLAGSELRTLHEEVRRLTELNDTLRSENGTLKEMIELLKR